jgi:hypothetical protein
MKHEHILLMTEMQSWIFVEPSLWAIVKTEDNEFESSSTQIIFFCTRNNAGSETIPRKTIVAYKASRTIENKAAVCLENIVSHDRKKAVVDSLNHHFGP